VLEKEFIMKKDTLIKKIETMANGDSFSVEWTDRFGCKIGTYVSKTRWFDCNMVIFGGADDEIITATDHADGEVENEAVKSFMTYYDLNDNTDFKIGSKSEITVTIKSHDWINDEEVDNMVCATF
jgi:hypothetical protein